MLFTALKLLLFALTALFLGILLGRWWIRRSLAAQAQSPGVPRGPRSTWDRLCDQLDVIDGGVHQPTLVAAQAAPVSQAPPAKVAAALDAPPAAPLASAAGQAGLTIVLERISDLERYVRTLPRSQHQLDLSPIRTRLGEIEAQLAALQRAPAAPVAPVTPVAPVATSTPTATPGPLPADREGRDDLTRIRGIGPRLAALLAEQGVYYFWQIASWTAADIAFMDQRLERFSGRIERDDWVGQAKLLASASGAKPA